MRRLLADNTEESVREFVRQYFRSDIARSIAYINAFQAAIKKRVIEHSPGDIAQPYPPGTAEADAWGAGYQAGRAVYLDGVR